MEWESVIGIEVHAQLKTKTKTFCSCKTSFGQTPNSNVCPVCLGLPGALPVLNLKVMEMAIQAGLALNCAIQPQSIFARKNYFYPDLPKGYQISQYDQPICTQGYLDLELKNQTKRIRINRVHIEEDAGKLIHQGSDAIYGANYSLVDLNRASTPLIEIVSEPDIHSAEEARIYVETLKQVLEYIGVCDGNLEEGSLRADANISLRPKGSDKLGTKTEVKNLNSFRSIERAVISEIERQKEILASGGRIIQQTRNYDDTLQKTTLLRSKEEAHDYRYFPDPDLTPLIVPKDLVEQLKKSLPELPQKKKERYRTELNLAESDIATLLADKAMNTYFETCLNLNPAAVKEIAKWIIGDLSGLLKANKTPFSQCPVKPEWLITLIDLINRGNLSGKMAKDILNQSYKTQKDPEALIQESGAEQISDTESLKVIVLNVLKSHPDIVEKIKSGKTNAANFLMGQVMRETRGQAKPDLVLALLLELAQQL